jgi:hypothetical protein
MKKFLSKFFKDELPKSWIDLIDLIRKNHPESGGEYRAAMAEIQARSAWELNRATRGLKNATWILSFSTIVLCLITLFKN